MTDPDGGITYQAVIDGDSFMNSIARMLYGTSIIPRCPGLFMMHGAGELVCRIPTLILRPDLLTACYSVLCAEDADFPLTSRF
jgi:hypothetical protein